MKTIIILISFLYLIEITYCAISLASTQPDHVKDRLNQARAIHAKIKANTATELDLKFFSLVKCIFFQ